MHIRCPHCGNDVREAATKGGACPECAETHGPGGAPSWPDEPPPVVGRFALLERLGGGAFGTVWRAHDPLLDRMVAVKIPRARDFAEPDVASFLREARSAAQLRHPNIVRVHEVVREGGSAYIVSDLVEGVTLAKWLADRRPSPGQAAAVCAKIARALQHAHEQGVIHRDLKPSNVMLGGDGEPYVLDFGLAKREAGEAIALGKGQVLGTPAYMPPEQARGEGDRVDGRADVYSLGVILFELLAGRLPFEGSTAMLLHQLVTKEAPSPRRYNRRVPRDLEQICLKCLRKEAESRYASAGQLADDLDRFLARKPVLARPLGVLQRSWRRVRRSPALAGTAAACAIAIALAAHLKVEGEERALIQRVEDVRAELQDDGNAIRQLTAVARSRAYPGAIVTAEKLLSQGRIGPTWAYNLACVYALAAESVSKDARLGEADRKAQANQYLATAVGLLDEAQRAGYFRSPDQYRHLLEDLDLRSLWNEPAFGRLVRRLKEEWE